MTTCTNYGCTRRAPPGFMRCTPCRQEINGRLRLLRAQRRRRGLCVCGRSRARHRKHCQQCLDFFSAYHAEKSAEWELEGLCPKCGREPTGGFKVCRFCRGQQSAEPRQFKAPSGLTTAQRVQACKRRWRAAGRCITCGKRAGKNPRTGKPYAMCSVHRAIACRAKQRLRDRAGSFLAAVLAS